MTEIFGSILIPTGEHISRASADYIFEGLINGVLLLAGMVAVIGIIVSAIRYITSQGDAAGVSKAKQGLLYSIIGVIVVAVSFGVVRFVVAAISGTGGQ